MPQIAARMFQRATFTHRGFRLSYLDTGPADDTRPVILLLHGFPDTAQMWAEHLDRLQHAGYRCIAPDTLGCGESQMAPKVSDYNAVRVAADHAALLDHLGIEQVHVVGHDWGAVLAWFLAGYFPQRVRSLVVMGVGHPTSYGRSGWAQKLRGWYTVYFQLGGIAERLLSGHGRFSLRRVFGTHPDMESVMQRLAAPGRMTAALRLYRAGLVPILFRKQPRIAAPTLGIWSEQDAFLVEAQMQDSADWVDGRWRYLRLGGGHWVPLEQPDRLQQVILEHITSTDTEITTA